MSWNVMIYENGSSIYCDVDHAPNNYLINGVVKTVNLSHSALQGWTPPSDFDSVNDEIVLLYLIQGTNSSTKSTFNSKRNTLQEKQFVVFVPVEETSSGTIRRGPGKRTSKKVSNELGGE